MSEHTSSVRVTTRFNSSIIEQDIEYDNAVTNPTRQIIQLQDEGVIEALKKLGWTPPGGERDAGAINSRISDLSFTDPIVHACLYQHRAYAIPYCDALEQAVIKLVEHNNELKNLITNLKNRPSAQ